MMHFISNIIKQTNLSEQEAWWIVEAISQKKKSELILLATPLSEQEQKTLHIWIQKIVHDKMPLAYLIGSVPFLHLEIKVKPPILIPRPETEEWVAKIISELQPHAAQIKTVLDIGTGSGCIALALAKHFDQAHVIATDINPHALKLAQENAMLNRISNVTFIEADLFAPGRFDLIVSNPPYIDPVHTLMPQVANWEDHQALFAQDKGLSLIKKIIQNAPEFLHAQATLPYQLVVEHDPGQEQEITKWAQQHGLHCSSHKDLFEKYRTSLCKLIN